MLADEIFESLHLLGFPMALVAAACLMNVATLPMSCQCFDIAEQAKVVELVGSNPLVSSWSGTVAMRLQTLFCSKSIGGGVETIRRLRQISDAISRQPYP